MPDVIRRIHRLRLRPYRQDIDRPLQSLRTLSGITGFTSSGGGLLKLFYFRQLIRIRQIMYPIDKRSSASYRLRHRPISKKHKLLDQMMVFVRLFKIDLRRMALVV